MAILESQRKATDKYLEKFEEIKFRVPKGDREKYKQYASSKGMSMNALIIQLLEESMKSQQSNNK